SAKRLGDYLEVMSKAVFQSGMSWAVVEKKWDGTREAFRKFEPLAVASLTEDEIAELTSDTRIIRNRKKVEAVVDNARKMVELDEAHKGFRKYLRSHGGFEGTVKDLRKQFRFMGETGCYYFLYVVKEEVPDYDTWCVSRGVTHTPAHVS
ncbi:MAG: DNA-3-methyladenine glycosylase I, partial [Chloroflexota bacterium]